MGGVDLWQNEDENYDNFDPQSMHDKILEVVSISGTWHLGKLQVKYSEKAHSCACSYMFTKLLLPEYFPMEKFSCVQTIKQIKPASKEFYV